MNRVTKFISRNLLGENRKEEAKRLLHERIKARIRGVDSNVVSEMKRGGRKYLVGTSPYQRRRRRSLLNKIWNNMIIVLIATQEQNIFMIGMAVKSARDAEEKIQQLNFRTLS